MFCLEIISKQLKVIIDSTPYNKKLADLLADKNIWTNCTTNKK